MGEWSLGSVAEYSLLLTRNISDVSGSYILSIADQQRQKVADSINITIGSNSIAPEYQSPISELTAAKLIKISMTQGTLANSIGLGDFSINKGKGNNYETMAENLIASANASIEEIKMNKGTNSIRYYKALG